MVSCHPHSPRSPCDRAREPPWPDPGPSRCGRTSSPSRRLARLAPQNASRPCRSCGAAMTPRSRSRRPSRQRTRADGRPSGSVRRRALGTSPLPATAVRRFLIIHSISSAFTVEDPGLTEEKWSYLAPFLPLSTDLPRSSPAGPQRELTGETRDTQVSPAPREDCPAKAHPPPHGTRAGQSGNLTQRTVTVSQPPVDGSRP